MGQQVDDPNTRSLDATPAPRPGRIVLDGTSVTLMPLAPAAHARDLFEALRGADHLWTYLTYGPFTDYTSFRAHTDELAASSDPFFFSIVETPSGRAVGRAALMRIEPAHRVIEVGHILYSPGLQRTRGATEAMYLLARYVFEDLGYRRYEWKCNALNEGSRAAAGRLGFVYEGTFRQHMIVKGRNRDTAWFSMLDVEWPERKRAFERWLAPANFDANGRQLCSLTRE